MSRLHTGFATRSRKNLNGDLSPSLTVDASNTVDDGSSPLNSPLLPSTKLTKPRTNDSGSKYIRPHSFSKPKADKPTEVETQASFSELRSTESRLKMRQQLTSPSPESPHNASMESFVTAEQTSIEEKAVRSRSSLDTYKNDDPISSSLTVNSVGTRKPGAVSASQKIDLEAAINLLQELKKSATPEELVALHRALLPTRDADTVVSSSVKTGEKATVHSTERKRSTLPPGLATRGGVAEDLLRRPGQPKVTPPSAKDKPTTFTAWGEPSKVEKPLSSPTSRFSKQIISDSIARPDTPSDSGYGHTGGFIPGTLHITNGRVSPAPSGKSARGLESVLRAQDTPVSPIDCKTDVTYLPSAQDRFAAEDGPSPVSPLNSVPLPDNIAMQDEGVERSATVKYSRAEGAHQKHWSTDVSTLPTGNKIISSTLLVPRPALESDQASLRAPASPTMPSSLQRRMKARDVAISVMSQEYMDECMMDGNSYEESPSSFSPLQQTVTRTPTSKGHVRNGTPEDALDILTGSKDEEKPVAATSTDVPSDADRPRPRHADSGYASDASLQAPQRNASLSWRQSNEVNEAKRSLDRTRWSPQLQQEDEEAEESEADGLTFEEALASASLYKVRVPKSTNAGLTRKPSRLLALRPFGGPKRSSNSSDTPKAAVTDSTDSVPSLSSVQPSPAEIKETKLRNKSKKLQKAPPKALRRKSITSQNVKSATEDALPEVPDVLVGDHTKRLEASPSVAHLEHTYKTVSRRSSTGTLDKEVQIAHTEIKFPSPTHSPVKEKFSMMKTFSRNRSGTETLLDSGSDSDVPDADTPGTEKREEARGRSTRSKRRSGSFFSKKSTEQVRQAPECTDFGDVTEMLGSSPYDVSTAIFKSSSGPSTSGSTTSPFSISGPLSRSRMRPGMSEEVASQVARLRSRDRAGDSMLLHNDCPRVAKPVQIQAKRSRSMPRPVQVTVEERFPDWQPVGRRRGPPKPRMKNRAYSEGAEAIPPLPAMPADAQRKAQKADIMVAKALGSTRSSPAQSTRSSLESSSGAESDNAAKIRAAVDARNAQWLKIKKQEEAKVLLHPNGPQDLKRQASAESSDTFQSTLSEPPKDQKITATAAEKPENEDQDIWAKSAAAWSERRRTLGETLPNSTGRHSVDAKLTSAREQPKSQPNSIPTSPSIVVSRYVTPAGQELTARTANADRPTDLAAKHASEYQNLLFGDDNDQENRPPQQDDEDASSFGKYRNSDGTSISHKLYATAATGVIRTPSPGGHVRTPTGSWIPYSPAVARQAEESLAQGTSVLVYNSATATTTVTTTTVLAEEPKSLLREPVRRRPSTSPTTSCHFTTTSTTTVSPSHNTKNERRGSTSPSSSIPDRYSGGLGYGWDRRAGFIGSAGVMSTSGGVESRRSVGMNDQFGLDLTDVPVFLARVQGAIRDV